MKKENDRNPIEEWLDHGILHLSISDFPSSIVLVRKKEKNDITPRRTCAPGDLKYRRLECRVSHGHAKALLK